MGPLALVPDGTEVGLERHGGREQQTRDSLARDRLDAVEGFKGSRARAGLAAEPDDDTLGAAVDVVHLCHLLGPFFDVALVYVDGVDPHDPRLGGAWTGPQLPQRRLEVLTDGECRPVELD